MHRRASLGLTLSLALWLSAAAAEAQSFTTVRVATGLDRPVFLTAPPGDTSRVFVVEQHTGVVRILHLPDHVPDPDPFLDLDGLATDGEQGLLGLAFDPDYDENGFFYVNLTDPTTRVMRFRVSAGDPDRADPTSATQILAIPQPQSNHNGGWLGFGPDGMLYVATGDGGAGNDEGTGHTPDTGNAQDTTDNLLGKILRLDVRTDAFPGDPDRHYAIPADNPFVGLPGDDEIWAYGLRNPWRPSFDRETGDLWIADVGQGACEEIDFQPATSVGGENYGWRIREGVIANPTPGIGGPAPTGAIEPIFDYPHPFTGTTCSGPPAGVSGFSVTGGTVYRGPIPELVGRYFFADFFTARLWSFRPDGDDPTLFDGTNYTDFVDHSTDPRFVPDEGSIDGVSSFGEDAAGRLYVLDLQDGEVFLVPEPTAGLLQPVGLLTTLLLARRARRSEAARVRRARTGPDQPSTTSS